jgi:hypothetical protein
MSSMFAAENISREDSREKLCQVRKRKERRNGGKQNIQGEKYVCVRHRGGRSECQRKIDIIMKEITQKKIW